jgi:hypothetical protein
MSTNANSSAFPIQKQILGSGVDYHEINAQEGLSKLEYALIHGNWEPSKQDIDMEVTRDRNKNPHNDSYKPRLRSYHEIIRDLKKQYYTTLLSL